MSIPKSIPMSTSTSLAEKLAAIKEANNPSLTSSSNAPTPLATYLVIYNKSGEGYTNYMQGAKALATYLAPIDIPDVSNIPEGRLPKYIPDLINSYALDRLVRVLLPPETYADFNDWLRDSNKLEKIIIYLTIKDILPDL